nr:ubiquinol-cytochrome-c reductase complex assembly factor 2 [Pelodiscus sinensis]|eukprot:XP_014427116.1 ubiquinol-cytochrome-c reductase complex assembly factor 2 [Pelodiscus sinensis]
MFKHNVIQKNGTTCSTYINPDAPPSLFSPCVWPVTYKGKRLWYRLDRVLNVYVLFQIADPATCDQMYESLVRIHTNFYKNKYPRLKDTSFTGVTVEECKLVLASDTGKENGKNSERSSL